MHLEIITPDKKVFEGEVEAATFPGTDGEFQVLKDHAPIISSLAKGQLVYRDNEGDHSVGIDSGVVEVLNNTIIVLAQSVLN